MEAGSESYARLQTNEYRAKVNALRTSGAAVLAAGDFNIDGRGSSGSNATTIASWYTPYFEADNTSNCRTCARPTTDGNQRKLDYIFRANPKTIAHSAYMFDAAHSDHDWLQMYL